MTAGPGIDHALAEIAERFGGAEPASPPDDLADLVGTLGWSSAVRDHNDSPVGGLIVDIGINDADGPYVITAERTGQKGPRCYRTRRIPVAELFLPTDIQTTTQLLGHVRWLGGCMRERGSASSYTEDRDLARWITALLDKAAS